MLEKVSLFRTKGDFFYFILLMFLLFLLSISYEFFNYKQLTKFDSQLINAVVLKQYTKTKLTKKGNLKSYQVLQLKSSTGFTFYTIASKNLQNIHFKHIQLEVWTGKISFYEYIHGFFCFSKILQIYKEPTLKEKFNSAIDAQHKDKNISLIYQALFSAKQLPREIQSKFSQLGISHLIAISGFHLGVLSFILFFLLKYPYKFFQNLYFPHRSIKRDSFFIVSAILLIYLLFLDAPPSLVRAFTMLLLGFLLYDRAITIISMQTLLVTTLLILALFPRLLFSIGLFLSLAGVFSIFLFFNYFKEMANKWQFFILPIWVYLMMLPYSLLLFGNFTLYHPLSILYSILFTLFYPLSIALHFIGNGDLLDPLLQGLLSLQTKSITLELPLWLAVFPITLSFLTLYKKNFIYPLLLLNCYFLYYSFSQL